MERKLTKHLFPTPLEVIEWSRSETEVIVNPAKIEEEKVGQETWEYYLKRDLVAMMDCDVLVLLNGWQESRGAQLEVFNAYVLGMEFMDENFEEISKEDIWMDLDVHLILETFKEPEEKRNTVETLKEKVDDDFYYNFISSISEHEQKRTLVDLDDKIKKDRTPLQAFNVEFGFVEQQDTLIEKEDATTILKKADELTNCDRQEAYGHPATNFQNTANFWNTYVNGKYPEINLNLTNEDVGFLMLLLKVSRELNAPKFDNLLDGIGYLKTIQMIRDCDKFT